MKRIYLLLIIIVIVFSGCSSNGNIFPTIVPKVEESNRNTSNVEPKGGYWRFVRSECNEFVPINDTVNGNYWNGDIVSNNIMATYIVTDKTVVGHFVEQEFVYNWAWGIEVTPTGDQDNLYYGSTVNIRLGLEYTGIDPNKLLNYAEMYAGAFGYYPTDNRVLVNGPGGIGEKVVSIEIPKGNQAGDIASIDIVCSGSCPQSFTYKYYYEWVE